MSGILDTIQQSLGGDAVQNISQKIGANPQQTQIAIAAALPMILAGLTHNVQQPGGADALHAAVQRDHDGSLLDNLGALLGGGGSGDGDSILGHVLGGRRDAAQQTVAGTSGINAAQAATVLMTLAPIVMAAIGRMQRSQGMNSGNLANAIQGEQQRQASAAPDLVGMASQIFGGSGGGAGKLGDLAKGLGGLFGNRG